MDTNESEKSLEVMAGDVLAMFSILSTGPEFNQISLINMGPE